MAPHQAGFDNVFISPYPGDEGIALGCAEYALHQLLAPLWRGGGDDGAGSDGVGLTVCGVGTALAVAALLLYAQPPSVR